MDVDSALVECAVRYSGGDLPDNSYANDMVWTIHLEIDCGEAGAPL